MGEVGAGLAGAEGGAGPAVAPRAHGAPARLVPRAAPCSDPSVQRAFGDLLRLARASGQLGHALGLAADARLAESRDALLTVLEVAGQAAEGLATAAWISTRLCALMSLAEVGAKLGDRPLALASAREALALWDRSGLDRGDPRFGTFAAWEAWARPFLAGADANVQ